MPLHEFRCDGCEEQFEVLVRNGEKPLCPACGSSRAAQLVSASRVRGGLTVMSRCPPPEAGPCGPACCRLPT